MMTLVLRKNLRSISLCPNSSSTITITFILLTFILHSAYPNFKHGPQEFHPRDPRNEIFNNGMEDEVFDDENDYEEYDDEEPLPNWGSTFNHNDTNEIAQIEREEEFDTDAVYGQPHYYRQPKISKCCSYGEGLNAQGRCQKLTIAEHNIHKTPEMYWFPDRMINLETSDWVLPNETEWEITSPSTIKCNSNESLEVISDTDIFAIVNNGKLFLPHHSKEVGSGDYCVDVLIGKGRAVKSCFTKDELCKNGDCLRKCCPEGAVVDESSDRCYFHSSTIKNKFPKDKYNITHGTPSCEYGQYKTSIIGYISIAPEGNLLTSGSINASFLNYCLDFFIDASIDRKRSVEKDLSPSKGENRFDVSGLGGDKADKGDKDGPFGVLKAIVCFDSSQESMTMLRGSDGLISVPKEMSITYGVAFILSAICIALAAIISWHLPELRSLHGKCQLSHLGTLFFLFVLLAIVHLGSVELVTYTKLCTFLAVTLHTCTLSAFLWLNLLCVNIYLTFRSLRPPLAARRDENKRLFFLCIYAWGIPIGFCTFLFILDQSPDRLDPMFRPQYGNTTCLISNWRAMLIYLYGPVGFLLLLNGILFCLTARELLCGLWRLDNSDSISFRRKSMGIVVAKLGVVMGMGWILDVLSSTVGRNTPYIFYIADLFNGLQGVFMFLVLIWRKRVLEILKLRRPSLIKDETLSARPFLPSSKSLLNTQTQNTGGTDPETSLVLSQDP